jgi:hypothetical protein
MDPIWGARFFGGKRFVDKNGFFGLIFGPKMVKTMKTVRN